MTVRRRLSPRRARRLIGVSAAAGLCLGALGALGASSGALAASSGASAASSGASAASFGAPAASRGAAVPGHSAAPPACQTGGLVIWMNTQGNGAAGTIFYTLNFTNLSGHACTLHGYPGVSAVNLRGGALGRAAGRESGQRVRTITLTAGHTAHATLGIVDIGALSATGCPPTTAAGLRVFPPNQRASKVIPFPFPACGRAGGAGPAFLRVRPITR